MKNFSLPKSSTVVSQLERRDIKKGQPMTSAKLKMFLAQVHDGTWSQKQMLAESAALLKALEEKEEEDEEQVHMDYTSKQLEGLRKKYQSIVTVISTFMVKHGQWGTYSEESPDLDLPTHLLSDGEEEEQLTGIPMSVKCCSQIHKLLNSKEDLKRSKTGGFGRVWPSHFSRYCHFRTSMTDEEIHAVWVKDQKQVKKLVDRDTARKASMEAAVTQVHFAEEAIKNGSVVETVSGVINTASFLAKDYLDECIQHRESDRDLDREGHLASLLTAIDRIQMASMANALNEIAGFGMVDVATRKVHAGIRTLRLQTAKAVLSQSDLGKMERLLTEIPVIADALFEGGLTK